MKQYKKKNILLILLLFANVFLYSQESGGGSPFTYSSNYSSLFYEGIATRNLPYIDNNLEAHRADSISQSECSDCKNSYYGKGINETIDIVNTSYMRLADSSRLWLYNIKSPTALGMQFYFDKFKIPEGAMLFIYNEQKDMLLGAFTSHNNQTDERFGTQYITGNSIFIEYWEPKNVSFSGQVRVFKIIHVFKNLDLINKSGPHGISGACNIDVKCPLGNGWSQEISSVALILIYNANNNYSRWCSGAVINNSQQDGTPYFLSANHCIAGINPSFDYRTWLFLFNHEAIGCNATVYNPGQSVYGSTKLASDAVNSAGHSLTSDYLLLKLNCSAQTLKDYGVCYSGWDRSDINATGSLYTIGIHHPSGDVKKISEDNNTPVTSSYLGLPNSGTTHWRVQWDEGVTEPVSSGSPLYNLNHKIVGQLHGGYSRCDLNLPYGPNEPDYYGKFSMSFTNGSFNYVLGNAMSVNTYCPVSGSCSDGILNQDEEGIDCGGSCPPCIVSLPCVNCFLRQSHINIFGCLKGADNGGFKRLLAQNMNVGAQGFFNAGGRTHLIVDSEYQNGSPNILSGRISLQDGFVFISTGADNELRLESCNLGNLTTTTWPSGTCSKWSVNPCPKDNDRNKNRIISNMDNNSRHGLSENKLFLAEGIKIIPNPTEGNFILLNRPLA